MLILKYDRSTVYGGLTKTTLTPDVYRYTNAQTTTVAAASLFVVYTRITVQKKLAIVCSTTDGGILKGVLSLGT